MGRNIILYLVLSLVVFGLSGCGSNDPAGIEPVGRLEVTTGSDALSGRVDLTGVRYILDGPSEKTAEDSHEITLVGSISPPTNQDGVAVRATFVQVVGDKAYVGYNKEGEQYAGAIEVVDISNPSQPAVVSQALFDDTDVAALTISPDGGTLLAAGARDIDQTGFAYPAMVEAMTLSGGNLTSTTTAYDIPAYVANGVVWGTNWISVSSGNADGSGQAGGAGAFSHAGGSFFDPINWDAYNNSQYLVAGLSGSVALEVGQNAKFHIYTSASDSLTPGETLALDPILPVDGKNTLAVHDGILYAALGTDGMKAYDMSSWSQTPVYSAPRPTIGDGLAADYLTNSVAADDDFVYLANGAGGLYVGRRPGAGASLDVVGTWDFSSSANFVAVSDDLIFVASGNGGLKIARKATQVTVAQAAFKTKVKTRDDSKIYGNLYCNTIAPQGIRLQHRTLVDGDVFCGPAGVPPAVIKTDRDVHINGTTGRLDQEITFSSRTAPDLGASVGNLVYTSSVTFNADFFCDELVLQGDALATVEGDVTIVVEDEFRMRDRAQWNLADGATLTIFVKTGLMHLHHDVKLNHSGTPDRVNIYYLGTNEVQIYDRAFLKAYIEANDAKIKLRGDAKFYGSMTAEELALEGRGLLTIQ